MTSTPSSTISCTDTPVIRACSADAFAASAPSPLMGRAGVGVNSPPAARMDCRRHDHPLPTLPHRGGGHLNRPPHRPGCRRRRLALVPYRRGSAARPRPLSYAGIRRLDLESHRKPELLCGLDGLCRICPVLARTRHAAGWRQAWFRQCCGSSSNETVARSGASVIML
jgi:hypothetical protein